MKFSISLFIIFAFLAAFGGPLIASTSGSDLIMTIANVTTFGGALLSLVFGVRAAVKSQYSKGGKAGLIVLVIVAVLAAMFAAAMQFA